jgi:RNA polymerase sigma-70 factor (ECF subfamily)
LISDSEELLSFAAGNLDSAELQFDEAVNAEVVHQALQKLEQKYTEVLLLRFFEHKDYDEISDILQIPIGSVGTLIHRGKKQLATVINNEHIRI